MKRQREEENYWDKYENFSLDSSFEKSDSNKSGLNQTSFDKEEKEIMKINNEKEDIYKSLRDKKREIKLEIEKHTFEPKQESDKSDYF